MRHLLLAGMLCLGACTSTPEQTASRCETARQAVLLAQIGLGLACGKASKTCDDAGWGLRLANDAVRAFCPQ